MRLSPLVLILVALHACQQPPPQMLRCYNLTAKPLILSDSIQRLPIKQRQLSKAMIPVPCDSGLWLQFEPAMFKALDEQQQYLENGEVRPVSGISRKDMLETVHLLKVCTTMPTGAWQQYFDFYQVNTELQRDRVRITGYYTPSIDAAHTAGGEFQVPMLARPESGVPAPDAIHGGALAGRGLELAWLRSKRELANAQLQGSCMVQFPDGDKDFLGFGGSVKGSGGTYVFFKKINKDVLGSGSFPLTAGYSAAIDPRFIPLGATILAELPVVDKIGNVTGYRYQIIFAQDRGGAIQTTKRLDLYCGIGKKGLDSAKRVNAHGRLWLMLPKKLR